MQKFCPLTLIIALKYTPKALWVQSQSVATIVWKRKCRSVAAASDKIRILSLIHRNLIW